MSDRIPADFTTGDGPQSISFGKTVRLADNWRGSGTPGRVYTYMGATPAGKVDLSAANYGDTGYWALKTGWQQSPFTAAWMKLEAAILAIKSINSDWTDVPAVVAEDTLLSSFNTGANKTLATGTRIRLDSGARAGEVYEFVGANLDGTVPIVLTDATLVAESNKVGAHGRRYRAESGRPFS